LKLLQLVGKPIELDVTAAGGVYVGNGVDVDEAGSLAAADVVDVGLAAADVVDVGVVVGAFESIPGAGVLDDDTTTTIIIIMIITITKTIAIAIPAPMIIYIYK